MIVEYISKKPDNTIDLGIKLGRCLTGGELILLNGDLGSGKTLFTKGIAEGLLIDDPSRVVSPSFTLVNIYQAKLDIVHVDLYRLDSDEVWELGLEDYMNTDHIMVVEWADRAKDFFKGHLIEVIIEYQGELSRKFLMKTSIPWVKLDTLCETTAKTK
ncbi:MAG: tRNA (adenosine(37)-N6)-threonylcarbamoyltransferase complex ATPase subunit type 1 TsaE [Deltaproteobacteria bacterium]|nr:tRNA (adenosine(37)-N6)-threonylcarbamoyltransferase complex ATPase subunit type 1 TsaE [Deltaproteobacteria bacterium]